MEIKVKGRIAARFKGTLKAIGVTVNTKSRGRHDGDDDDDAYDVTIDMTTRTQAEVQRLHDELKGSGVQGTKLLVADLGKYLRAAKEGPEIVTARSVRQAAWLLEQTIARLPHHLLFSEDSYGGGSYVGYFVNDVCYHPERISGSSRIPEHVEIELVYIDNDAVRCAEHKLEYAEVHNKTAAEMLRGGKLILETPALIARLKEETERCYAVREAVGTRYQARGIGVCDLDDDVTGDSEWRSERLILDAFGAADVVVDVVRESDKDDDSRHRDVNVQLYRWHSWNQRFFSPDEDELARHLAADSTTDFVPDIQVPVHPLVPCFDLRRHARLRVHVNNLTQYAYRPEAANGLIIPPRDRALIDMLVGQSANKFRDVIVGKGASMNVLACGEPGTGKTLTAEAFAEFKGRPLYTVQCSQLGLDPDTIENNLAVILRRANRWNAVLLLDEADVYIARRGSSLAHNAIVGVFLRMLEYASCILFMTTNRDDDVDDAIASRCIVKLTYQVPTVEAQCAIWRNLADLNGIPLADDVIAAFAADHPEVTGRDVKNLLKLSSFYVERHGGPVDREVLDFALQYKPTATSPSRHDLTHDRHGLA